jgi:hypothetical protein
MKSLSSVVMTVALALLAAAIGGCPSADDLLLAPGSPGDRDPGESNGVGGSGGAAGEEPTSDTAESLAELALGIVASDGDSDRAFSEGYVSVSTSGDYSPPSWYPPGYNPYSQDDSGGSTGGSGWSGGGARGGDDSGDSGGSGGSDGSGGSGGSGCTPESGWHGWPGDYNGPVDCQESEWLEGYGESDKDMTFCISMSFDAAGVPDWIPIPVFASAFDRLLQVDVRFTGESGVFSAGSDEMYDVVVNVVSARYTATTADVELEIDQRWIGDYSSIKASGTHTLHTEVVGDSLVYSSRTHYDGRFFAEAEDEDWEANATQDFDCSATLTKP